MILCEKVSCGSGQTTLLMRAKKFGDYNIKVEWFVPRVFQKGNVHGVDVDLSDDELSGGFRDHKWG